ncbi:hypothetical protein SUGI_0694750 [Cryptomeria japonica]|nr:hypothetical protein SUGI_0694750 [Cryptomeria japonica]
MDLHAELNESVQLIVKGAILSCSQESKGYMRGDKDFMDRQELQQLTKNKDDIKTSPEMRRKVKLGDSSTSTFRQDQRESGIAPQPSPAASTICRVRQDLRAIQPEKYNPKRVALGICNHAVSPYLSEMDKEKVNMGKEKVNMGEEKVKALCTTIKRLKDATVESLVAEIQGFDLEIRKWYDHSRDSLPEEILAWNFAMDGCFILEFFRSLYRIEDPIVEREIMTDILMLENQIPLFVLKKILELEFQTPEKTISCNSSFFNGNSSNRS